MIDRIDAAILRALQAHGRISNADLADEVGLSASACLRRVKTLEEEGFIVGYHAQVNPQKVGRASLVLVEITLSSQSQEALNAFEKAARENPEILECHLMAGEADYLVRVAAADAADFERIHRQHLSRLPGVARMRSNFVLKTVREMKGVVIDPQG